MFSDMHAKAMKAILDKAIADGAGMEAQGMEAKGGTAGLQITLLTGPISGAVQKADGIDNAYTCATVGMRPRDPNNPNAGADPVTLEVVFTPACVVSITVPTDTSTSQIATPDGGGGIVIPN